MWSASPAQGIRAASRIWRWTFAKGVVVCRHVVDGVHGDNASASRWSAVLFWCRRTSTTAGVCTRVRLGRSPHVHAHARSEHCLACAGRCWHSVGKAGPVRGARGPRTACTAELSDVNGRSSTPPLPFARYVPLSSLRATLHVHLDRPASHCLSRRRPCHCVPPAWPTADCVSLALTDHLVSTAAAAPPRDTRSTITAHPPPPTRHRARLTPHRRHQSPRPCTI